LKRVIQKYVQDPLLALRALDSGLRRNDEAKSYCFAT
jgi:hypothetical protein